MKITKLKIEGYKNLEIELEHSSDLIAFIGNNGSGKSNTLEALSIIFSYLYKKDKNIPFNFCLEYTNTLLQKVKIEKNGSTLNSFVDSIRQVDISNHLPKRMIAIYSGEDDRLWKGYYSPHYFSFVEEINKAHNQGTPTPEMPKMLYLNKFYWHISLLSLALSDSPDNQCFLKDILKIENVDKIKFEFAKGSYANYSSSSVLNFIRSIDSNEEYTLAELKQRLEGTTLPATLPMSFGYSSDEIYRLLYLAFSPESSKFVTDIQIIYNGGLTVDDFSEGEKKLLLIKAAFEFASQEDSLFILDEPDAHIHVNNKEQITKALNPYKGNRQIVITTHSPTLTQSCSDENLFMIDKGQIIDKSKQDLIADLTGKFWNKHQQSSFLSSTKPVTLFVEGKHDKIHIKNAFNFFKAEYPDIAFDVYDMDGACNIPQILTGLKTSEVKHETLFIGIFDNDKEGRDNCNQTKVNCIDKKSKLIEKCIKKGYVAFCYPKPDSYKAEELTVENLFESSKYESAYREVLADYSFENKSIEDSSKDIKEKAKAKLSQSSSEFVADDFKYFRPLFDRVNEIYGIYSPKTATSEPQLKSISNSSIVDAEPEKLFYLKRDKKNIEAKATYNEETKKVTILKGSKISKEDVKSAPRNRTELRRVLKETKIIVENEGALVFQSNPKPLAPSAASSLVLGSSSNGWREWKDKEGKTLDELYRDNSAD